MEGMRRGLDFAKAEAALKRAAHKAVHGTREERSGRFLVSSTIKSAEYDDDVRELDITFTSGKTYRYFNVPLEIYAEFLDAGSRGKFFNDNIKGKFAFAEVARGWDWLSAVMPGLDPGIRLKANGRLEARSIIWRVSLAFRNHTDEPFDSSLTVSMLKADAGATFATRNLQPNLSITFGRSR
jgi:hypothetical protein